MVSQKRISRTIDIVFCVVVLPLLLSIIPIEKMFANSRIFTILLVTFLYGVYFIIRYVRFPRMFMKRKWLVAVLLLSTLFAITYVLARFPLTDDFIMNLPEGDLPIITAHRTQRVWFLFLVVCGFSLSIDLTVELFRQMISKRELEHAKERAELSLYRAQISPHFLFNSLNTIYGMIVTGSERTEDAFVRFTDILKYMYDYPTADKVSIGREIEYIGNYIEFQSFRYGDCTEVYWNVDMDETSGALPPMILVTFIENAFKYGASSSVGCRIDASAVIKDRHLHFKVSNRILNRREDGREGIGIENCRKRLDLLCFGKYVLDIKEDNDMYNVMLDLELC